MHNVAFCRQQQWIRKSFARTLHAISEKTLRVLDWCRWRSKVSVELTARLFCCWNGADAEEHSRPALEWYSLYENEPTFRCIFKWLRWFFHESVANIECTTQRYWDVNAIRMHCLQVAAFKSTAAKSFRFLHF